jgi:hypothetical protein
MMISVLLVSEYKFKKPGQVAPGQVDYSSAVLQHILYKGNLDPLFPYFLDAVGGYQTDVRIRAARFDIRKGCYNFTG